MPLAQLLTPYSQRCAFRIYDKHAFLTLFAQVAIGDVLDWISPALSSKNPQVKEGTLKFLHRSLTSTTAPPPPSQIKPLSESLASLLSDSYEAARNEAAICLGTLMKIVGERPLNALMDTIEDVRKVKVKEAYENATVRCKTGGPPTRQQPGLSTAPKKQPAAKVEAPPVLENPSITAEPTPETLPKVAKGPPARLLSKKPTSTTTESGLPSDPQKVPPPIKKPPAASAANASKSAKAPAPAPTSVDVKYKHSAEEASSLAAELIPPSIATDLSDANWKTRLAALEEFAVWLEGCVESVDSEVVVRFLAKKGWSENNFQVRHVYCFKISRPTIFRFPRNCIVFCHFLPSAAPHSAAHRLHWPFLI
jgi:cytoskeleton-associated protein 5